LIIVKLQGGLGNQMFQYAFGLSRSAELNSPLYLDLSFFASQQTGSDVTYREYELGLFSDKIQIANNEIIKSFTNPNRWQKVLTKLGTTKKQVYREYSLKVDREVFNLSPPVYFDGYWQSDDYFSSHERLIREAFEFRKPLNSQSQDIADTLNSQQNTVSIHIRRGDYASSARTNELHGTCSVSYYRQAVGTIKSRLTDPHFYFFSDEPNWVKDNLIADLENYYIVQHNTGADSWQDMALMSQCQHHIIANSSFSWWGAWLNPDKEKIVIAPQNWFNAKTDYFNDADIIPKNWIKIANA
jgi:tellurite resistance-related uncharacterized protein